MRHPEVVTPLLALRTLPVLRGLPLAQLTALAREVEEVFVPAGSVLRAVDEPAESFHVVVDGRFRVERDGVGREARSGDELGVLELLAGEVAGTSILAESDATTLSLDGDALRIAAERHAGILLRLLAELARQVLDRPERLIAVIGGDAPVEASGPGLDRVGRLVALHRAPLLPSASMDALAELSAAAEETVLVPGEPLWPPRSAATGCLVICRGEIAYLDDTGAEIGRLGPGAIPGLPQMLLGEARRLDAVAVGEVIALALDRESFHDVLEDHFEMAWGMLGRLARALL